MKKLITFLFAGLLVLAAGSVSAQLNSLDKPEPRTELNYEQPVIPIVTPAVTMDVTTVNKFENVMVVNANNLTNQFSNMEKIVFKDPAVKSAYEIPTNVTKDFQVRLPSLQWHGMFSEITLPVAQQLIKEKYNNIRELTPKIEIVPEE